MGIFSIFLLQFLIGGIVLFIFFPLILARLLKKGKDRINTSLEDFKKEWNYTP